MTADNGWISLVEYWEPLKRLASERHGQKQHFHSSNLWTSKHNTHFYGLCGEAIVALLTGWRVDRTLRITGDPGYDFACGGLKYDAKTATYIRSPDLKEFPDKDLVADIYILVALDPERKCGRVVGWATNEQLSEAPTRDYGHGGMLSITHAQLARWGQLGLPPQVVS